MTLYYGWPCIKYLPYFDPYRSRFCCLGMQNSGIWFLCFLDYCWSFLQCNCLDLHWQKVEFLWFFVDQLEFPSKYYWPKWDSRKQKSNWLVALQNNPPKSLVFSIRNLMMKGSSESDYLGMKYHIWFQCLKMSKLIHEIMTVLIHKWFRFPIQFCVILAALII